jgi:hypothetical protein
VPMAVPEGAPTAAAAAKEPATPAVGPAGALAPAVTEGGPTEGCGHAAVVAPAVVTEGW